MDFKKQIIELSKFLGWEFWEANGFKYVKAPGVLASTCYLDDSLLKILPKFLTNSDTIRYAVTRLDSKKKEAWLYELEYVIRDKVGSKAWAEAEPSQRLLIIVLSSPTEQAEALLKVLGKWED